jgi:geranylgeranylglycerol-phosphate geranylgeranyltransferase
VSKVKVKAFLRLIRIEYSLFSALGVIIAGFLADDIAGFQWEYVFAYLVVFFCAAGSFAFNDYYDLKTDRSNNRTDRPLVTELLSPRTSFMAGIAFFALAVVFAVLLNTVSMVGILVSLPIFFLYNTHFKKMLIVKNLVIAYAFVATILLGAIVTDVTIEPLITYFAVMGFIVGFAFEVMLDLGDVDGDRQRGVNTIPVRFGLKRAALVCVILYAIIMVMDPIPFFVQIDTRLYRDYVFLGLILIPVVSYLFVCITLMRNRSKSSIFKLKSQVFLTMQVGSVAYLLGVLI